MLDLARARCTEEGLGNVELRLADALQDHCPPADCVVLNMVLHHLAAPGEALKQLARLVKAGGSLLVTELCSHNQSWARRPAAISGWASNRTTWPVGPMPRGSRPARVSTLA